MGPSFLAAAIGLAGAALLAPVGLAALAAAGLAPWPPLAAGAIVVLLAVAPPAGWLAARWPGMRQLAAALAQSREAELGLVRVLAAGLMFGTALAMAALLPRPGDAADALPVAVVALVAAWTLLLCVLRWPVAPPLRRSAATALDIALVSALLHYGGAPFAGFYPVYDLLILYIGLRFGPPALLDAALCAMLGFSAVILTTEAWHQEPPLAIGLLLALAALPACFAGTLNALGVARVKAARAEAARQSSLQLIADTLKSPAGAARSGDGAMPIADIVDLAAIEAGTFAPPVESFELRGLVKRSLLPAQASAAAKGVALRWRVDARLPSRLRGQAQTVARVLTGLADHAIEAAPTRAVCIALAPEAVAAAEASQLRLVLRVDGLGPVRESALAADGVPLSLRLVQRLVALVEGTFTIERQKRERMRLTITLPLAIEEAPGEPSLDLAGRSVLIATEDGDLARILAETLARWNSDPRWPEDINIALNDLSRLWQTRRRILIVDGRERLLSALSLAHNAALLGGDAPHVVLIAEETQLTSLGDVDEGEIAGFVPAPVTPALLANALDALPLEADRPAPITAAVPAAPRPPAPALLAPIAAQAGPEPLPEPAVALDPRAIDGLRALADDPAFLGELIGTFRIDARRIMERIDEAVAAGNTTGFAQSLQALRRAASPLGGTELCELLASLQGVSAGELRERGAIHIRRVDSELDRLTAALAELRVR